MQMDTDVNKFITIEKQKLSKDSDVVDKRISYFIISFYFVQILNLTTKTVFPIPESLYPKVSILFGTILVLIFTITILKVLKRSLIPLLFSEFLWISIFTISYLMGNAELYLLLNNAFWTIVICVPLGVYIYSIRNKEIFYNLFLKSSLWMTFILSFIFFSPSKNSFYNMSFSYALLIPTLFHINEWFKNKKSIYLLVFLFEIAEIMIYGSRGALMSLACFFVIRFILNDRNLVKKIGIIFIAIIIIMVFYYNFDKIGSMLLGFLSEKGYYSRNLTLLFSNKISYDSGRFQIFKYYFDLIVQKPFIGWGVIGGWINEGLGPHNMLIEIVLAFGVFIGGIIILLLLLSQLRVFFVKDKNTRDLLTIYMSICIVLYFVSGDVLKKPDFYIFLGLLLGTFKNNSLREGKK